MIKLALVVYFALLLISLLVYKKWSNPFVFFNLIWSLWLTVSLIGIPGVRSATSKVFLFFIIGGIVFNIAGFVFMVIDKAISSKKNYKLKPESRIYPYKQLLFSIIQCIILVYYIYKAFVLWNALVAGQSYEFIRGYYYSEENFSSTIEYLAVTYVFDPMVTLAEVVLAINLFDKKKSVPSLTVMLLNILLRALISGGRMIVFELAALIIICMIYQYKRVIRYNRKKLVKAVVAVGAATIVATMITQGRAQSGSISNSSAAFSSLFTNFTGSFTYFSVLENNNLYVPLQYGRAIFAGIIDMFFMVTNAFGLTNQTLVTNEIGTILSEFYLIGKYSYNAMPTMYYYFISDFGEIGIVIGCILFAFYATYTYCRCNRYQTYRSLALYMIMMLVIVESSMTWLPFKLSFAITLIYAMIFVSNKPLPKENKEEKREIL